MRIASARAGVRKQRAVSTVSDTFNRADSATDLNPASDGGSWAQPYGNMGISGNAAYYNSGISGTSPSGTAIIGSGGKMAMRQAPSGAFRIDFSLQSTTSNNPYLCFGFDAASVTGNGYLLICGTSSISFRRVVAGAISGALVSESSTVFNTSTQTAMSILFDGAGKMTLLDHTGATILQFFDATPPTLGRWCGWASDSPGLNYFFDYFNILPYTPPALTFVADNFNRTDSSSSLGTASDGGTWTIPASGGTWGISGNAAYNVTNGTVNGNHACALRNIGNGIHDVSIDITRANTSGWTSVFFQMAADGSTGMELMVDSTSADVTLAWTTAANTWGGTISSLTTLTAWTGGTTTLRVIYDPLTKVLTILQNGVQKYSAVPTGTFPTGAYAGIGQSVAGSTVDKIDNFSATAR